MVEDSAKTALRDIQSNTVESVQLEIHSINTSTLLAKLLEKNTKLRKLDIGLHSPKSPASLNKPLTDEGVIQICASIQSHPKLQQLQMQSKKKVDLLFIYQFFSVKLLIAINRISFSFQIIFPLKDAAITEKGAKAIADMLLENETVEQLYLCHSSNTRESGICLLNHTGDNGRFCV